MSVVIRLMRVGAKKRPSYRLVVADSRRQRDGRFLEILGHYNPIAEPFELVVHKEKVERWLGKGAQPSTQVASLLRTVGLAMRVARAAAAEGEATAPPAAKKPAKRRVQRKASPRNARRKATRAKKKAAVKA